MLNRVKEVRLRHRVPIRRAARQLNTTVAQAMILEDPETDLTITQLRDWQRVLSVPLSELLIDADGLSLNPDIRRRLLRLMKAARYVRSYAENDQVRIMTDSIIDGLLAMMPELDDVSAYSTGTPHLSRDAGTTRHMLPDPDLSNEDLGDNSTFAADYTYNP